MTLPHKYVIPFFMLIMIVETKTRMINMKDVGLQNVRMNTVILSSVNKIGFLMCARKCDKLSNCMGFNFKKSILLCELLKNTSTEYESADGWVFTNRSWIQDSGYSTGLAGKTCLNTGMKVKLWSNEVYCRVMDNYKDCGDIAMTTPKALSGKYVIRPKSGTTTEVFCDMDSDGRGWTVFQARTNEDVTFDVDWETYKIGFGDKTNYWLGNDHLHSILLNGNYTLRIDMEHFNGTKLYAKYAQFYVAGEHDKYQLSIGSYSGDAGDSMHYHNGMKFSTYDAFSNLNQGKCADLYHSGWWFNSCFRSNLNMKYYKRAITPDKYLGIKWVIADVDKYRSLKACSMKIKRNG